MSCLSWSEVTFPLDRARFCVSSCEVPPRPTNNANNFLFYVFYVAGFVLCKLCLFVVCQSPSIADLLTTCYNYTSSQFSLSVNSIDPATNSDLVYYEPFVQFLYGSYLQWDLEHALMDGTLPDEIGGELFRKYSFDALILPFFGTHCRYSHIKTQICWNMILL